MMVTIHTVNLYRDGGSIEFVVSSGDRRRLIRLHRPEDDGTRRILVDGSQVTSRVEFKNIINDIDNWSYSFVPQNNSEGASAIAGSLNERERELVLIVRSHIARELVAQEEELGSIREFSLRLVRSDDPDSPKWEGQLFEAVAAQADAQFLMKPFPHPRGGFVVLLSCSKKSLEEILRTLDTQGIRPVL